MKKHLDTPVFPKHNGRKNNLTRREAALPECMGNPEIRMGNIVLKIMVSSSQIKVKKQIHP